MLRGAERRRGPIFRLGAGDRALTQDAPGTHLHVPARGELDKFRGLAFGILTRIPNMRALRVDLRIKFP